MAKIKVALGSHEFEVDLVCERTVSQAAKDFTGWIYVHDWGYIIHHTNGVKHNERGPALIAVHHRTGRIVYNYRLHGLTYNREQFWSKVSKLGKALYNK